MATCANVSNAPGVSSAPNSPCQNKLCSCPSPPIQTLCWLGNDDCCCFPNTNCIWTIIPENRPAGDALSGIHWCPSDGIRQFISPLRANRFNMAYANVNTKQSLPKLSEAGKCSQTRQPIHWHPQPLAPFNAFRSQISIRVHSTTPVVQNPIQQNLCCNMPFASAQLPTPAVYYKPYAATTSATHHCTIVGS